MMGVIDFKRDQRISERARSELRLHCSEAGQRIDSLVRRLGLSIEMVNLPREYRAALIEGRNERNERVFRIVVNSDLSYEQRNLSIAHELGHYFLHKDDAEFRTLSEADLRQIKNGRSLEDEYSFGEVISMTPNAFTGDWTCHNKRLEREANAFAIAVVMPPNLVRRSVNFRKREVASLAREFSVPITVARKRMTELSTNQYQSVLPSGASLKSAA